MFVALIETTKKPVIFLDADGVIFSWLASAARVCGVDLTNPENRKFLYTNSFDDLVGKAQMWKAIDAAGEAFWADLEPLPWGLDLWALAQKEFGRDHTFVLSSPSRHPSCLSGKLRSVQKYLKTHNFMFGSAKYLCAKPTTLLVDDSLRKISRFKEHGGVAYHWPNDLFLQDNPTELDLAFKGLQACMKEVKLLAEQGV